MNRTLVAITIAAAGVPMLIGVAELPRPGDPEAPVHTHVAARYVAEGARETGAENLVTGVLLNYRAFDTFGEVVVIFAALAAVMAVLSSAVPTRPRGAGAANEPRIPVSPVVAFVIRLTAPFIAAFGAFVILKGHVSPGGGFQGGVILGALLMLLSLVLGRGAQQPLIPLPLARWLQAAAPLAFAFVGVVGLVITGALLGLPVEPEHHLLREILMITLELGIGIGGGAVILGLFLEMRGD
jgi:multicomponent Na+:H+ antiporter subunit B